MRTITIKYDKTITIRQNFKLLSKELKLIPQTKKFDEESTYEAEKFITSFLSEIKDIKIYDAYVMSKPLTVIFNYSTKNPISIALKASTTRTDDVYGKIISTISSSLDVMLEDFIAEESDKQNIINSQNYTTEKEKMEILYSILSDHNMSFGTLKTLLTMYSSHSIKRIPNSILNKYYPEQIV